MCWTSKIPSEKIHFSLELWFANFGCRFKWALGAAERLNPNHIEEALGQDAKTPKFKITEAL